MTEATDHRCPTCDGEMLEKGGQMFCPVCLLQEGMRSSAFGGNNPGLQDWSPPDIEHLAATFPNLDIEQLIGQGGMGAVYRVRQKELGRSAALKVLPHVAGSDPAFTERFLREARLLASLSHPHIVTVYEYGQRDGVYFILMEYVDGVTLRQASLADPIKRLSSKEALAVVGQLCEALQFAHDEGVVHRDIKPENILIDKRGRVKIADFGLAKLLGKPADLATLTKTHQLMGTPAYMSPEQIEGHAVIDHRADIYSLGVVFYELLTGELPLGRFQPPSQKAELDVRLDEVVFRTLEKEPERRYQHASDLRTDMEAIQNGRRVAASASMTKSNRWLRLLVVCWTLIGTSMALHFWSFANTAQQLAISIAVAAVVAVLLEAFNPVSRSWRSLRFGAGLAIGVLLPALMLLGHIRKIHNDLKNADARVLRESHRADKSQLFASQLDAALQQRLAGEYMGGMDDMSAVELGAGGFGGMSAMGGGEQGFGMSATGLGAGGYDGGGGMSTMESSDGGFAGNAIPAVRIGGTTVQLSSYVGGLNPPDRTAVNQILTDIHQKYLKLEADHSIVRIVDDADVVTTIHSFPEEWKRLENELWTRIDDLVDVGFQRRLRQELPLTGYYAVDASTGEMPGMSGGLMAAGGMGEASYESGGYGGGGFGMYGGGGMGAPGMGAPGMGAPGSMGDGGMEIAEHPPSPLQPGILGWLPLPADGDDANAVYARIRIRQKGRWLDCEISRSDGSGFHFPSSPKLPPGLTRFYHQSEPSLALSNARTAFICRDWTTLADCFSHTGRIDWSQARIRWLTQADVRFPGNVSDSWEQTIMSELAVQTMLTPPFVKADGTVLEIPGSAAIDNGTVRVVPAPGVVESTFSDRADELRDAVVQQTTLEERERVFSDMSVTLPLKCSAFYLVQSLFLDRTLNPNVHLPFDADAELSCDPVNGDTANGILKFPDGVEWPVRFKREDNNWKIDRVLTPDTSLLFPTPIESPATKLIEDVSESPASLP